jgi:hypothetical protein
MMPAPFDWTEEIESRICEELASGSSIRDIAAMDWAPSEPTIYRRMAADKEFAALISDARAAQQDYEVDRCVELADKATAEDWQVVKLRIWARQWRAAKLAPKKYGDKLSTELTGPNGGPLQVVRLRMTPAEELPE